MTTWQDLFNEEIKLVNIGDKIDTLEREYNKWNKLSSVLVFIGIGLIIASMGSTNVLMGLGVVTAVSGLINIAVLKIWMHIKLSMFQMILELRESREIASQ